MSIDAPTFDQAPRQAGENQFRFLLNILFDHWFAISFSIIFAALALSGAAWLLSEVGPIRFTKQADIRIVRSQWETEALKDVAGGTLFAITPKSLVERTDKATLAKEVAQALVQRDIEKGGALARTVKPEEMKQRADDIAGKLRIEVATDDPQRVRISVANCATAEEAENIGEFAARVFIDQQRQISLEDGKRTHEFVVKQLEQLQHQLFDAETREWEFKRQMGFGAGGKIDEEMSKMYDELKKNGITKDELSAKLAELESALDDNNKQLPQALGNVTDGVINNLFRDLDTLLQERLTMSQEFQASYPGLKDLDDQLAQKRQAILAAFQGLDESTSGSGLWKKRQEIYRQQMDFRMQRTELEVRDSALKRMLDELIPKIPDLANKNLQARQLEQETNSIREDFNKLTQREWKIRSAIDRGPTQLVRGESVRAAAVLPLGGSNRGLMVNALIGAVAGLVLSFSFFMMSAVNDTSIKSIEDVNRFLNLDVIGTIPRMRFGRPRRFLSRRRRAMYVSTAEEQQIDACIVTQHDPKSPISEAYRTLRTNFQFATMKKNIRTVMLSSAVPGEGKTTTAVNLAVTMADRGMRVLIVDTDLRRPNVHRVLHMERGPGLADVLREGLDPHSVIRPTRIQNLWIISSGRVPPNPSELIGSQRMAQLMQRLGEEFDLVICDAPSVLVVTDPVLLATHVDTCVMVVSTDNARRETVMRAKKLLETANCTIAGVVVNGLEATRRHYYYYYYYYDDGASVRRRWSHIF